MTESTNVDTQAGGAGAEGNTTPSASPQTGATVAVTPAQLSKLVEDGIEKALKPVKGEISGLYSRQDKDRNAFSEFMAEFKKQKKTGMSDDEAETAATAALSEREKAAKRDKAIDTILERFGDPASAAPAGNVQSGTEDQAKVISAYQLDANDAEVIANMKLQGAEFKAAIADLAFRRATKQPASPSGATTLTSAPARAADTQSMIDKFAEY